MPREDLALTIERQVVAIFAHQNMRQQARARHSLGDGALRRSSLVDRPAGAATIFGTPDAQNPQPCRHEVEHLTDRLADDTPIPVLDPGRGRTKTGRLWVYTRDDRPWGGPDPPAAVYFYSSDRKAERPASHLEGFKGVLQVDGYAGFERLTARGGIVLAACWAHTRRKFFDMHEATGSPIAAEALRRIAELYVIEKSIRGRIAEDRRSVRNTHSRPLVEAMKPWLETQLGRIPGRGGLAEAIRYTLSRWPALCRFLDDGRIELDNNSVERAIRPVALGRKNHLFAGSDGGAERWATVCSLVASAKLNEVEPFTYLKDVLQRMTEGHPMSRLDELLPWNWLTMRVKH